MDEPKPTPDGTAAPTGEGRDPLTKKIAVSLAAVVLLGAGLAILQTQASSKESNSARETTRVAVRAMSANVVVDTVLGVRSEVQGEREFLPFRPPLIPGAPTLEQAAGLASGGGRTAQNLREAEQALPVELTPQALDRLRVAAAQQTLKQQALATTRITWNDRSTQYTTVIAVLAAALFLVGFGLVVEGSIRRYSYVLGLAVALFAAGWAVWIHHLPIPSTPDTAIAATAEGTVLTGNGAFAAAVAAYDRAIRADSGYAAAYSGRARARLLAANPDYPVTRAFTAKGGAGTLAAVEDVQRAIRDGNGRDLLSFGILAIADFYDGRYADAIDAAERAIAINPSVPDVWLLKSAAEVALGDRAASNESLAKALGLLKGAEPSQRTRLLAASYLSYLAWVARYRPGQAVAANRLSERVVATETAFTLGRKLSGSVPLRGAVAVDGLRYADGKLSLLLRWRNLPPDTALSGIGYERPLERGAWTQPAQLALFLNVTGSGERRISVPLTRVCKPTRVRVDVFLNGASAISRVGPGVPVTC